MDKVIKQVYSDPNTVIIGEQVQGKDAYAVENCINQFYEATGEMPGMVGIDLGCYGFDLKNTKTFNLSSYICDLVDYAANGGIITINAHWDNPANPGERVRGELAGQYKTDLEDYQRTFRALITEGTGYNYEFKRELEINAHFLKALEENGIPVIWRPLHEANGSWFWFCIRQGVDPIYTLQPEYFVNLWRYVYNYFVNECGLTNLYWTFAPNYSSNVNNEPGKTASTTYLYPGDEYCDMVGVDWYTQGALEITDSNNYLNLVNLANKPGAITEFGPTGTKLGASVEEQPSLYSSMDMYNDLRKMIGNGHSFTYLLTWGGKWGVSAMGRGDELMQTDLCIGQTEIKAMFDALK